MIIFEKLIKSHIINKFKHTKLLQVLAKSCQYRIVGEVRGPVLNQEHSHLTSGPRTGPDSYGKSPQLYYKIIIDFLAEYLVGLLQQLSGVYPLL